MGNATSILCQNDRKVTAMESKTFLTDEAAYRRLQSYYNKNGSKINILELFKDDPDRFTKYSVTIQTPADGSILLDYSKNRINDEILKLLFNLAKARNVEGSRDAMFTGEKINFTEDRAVLHVALRHQSQTPIMVDGEDVVPVVKAVLDHMKDFSDKAK